jgi:cytochrome c oxidase assembly protein subunit 11
VFCEITGINGKNTGRVSAEQALAARVDTKRLVTVQFVAHVNGSLPWEFRPLTRTLRVHPGEVGEVAYQVRNLTARSIDGHAVPSLTPGTASKYLNKTECFCFVQQTLEPHESRDMPVRFVVDPDLPREISTVTLSYTFFGTDRAPVRNIERTAGAASDWGRDGPRAPRLSKQ